MSELSINPGVVTSLPYVGFKGGGDAGVVSASFQLEDHEGATYVLAAAWNPSRQFSEIAYTARLEGGGFDIAVVDLVSRQVRQITQGRGSCEYPSWAPSGRHLVFSCRRGNTWQITVADREGRTVQTLPAGAGNNSYPDWGPEVR